MTQWQSRVLRFLAPVAFIGLAGAFTVGHRPPARGMQFKLRVVLRHQPTAGRAPRAITLLGHAAFASGLGRVDIDSLDAPGPFRKGDFIIIRDSVNSFWARPSDRRVRRMNTPLVNPLEGISERVTSGTGSPSSLKVVFDTVSGDEMVNGEATRHYRITADVVYPVGARNVNQKVVIDQWISKKPVEIMNPFSSRIRGLPAVPMKNGAYREFIRTLAAANRVYGNGVTIRTQTVTSYVYGPGLGEDFYQTVDVTDLQDADIDPSSFQLSADYKLRPSPADSTKPVMPPRKPPVR
jgi:hypothetical protein